MRTAEQHAAAVLALAPPPFAVEVDLADALGLVTAAPVVARVDSPPFDNSAMDGFAVRWADVAPVADRAPVALRIVGESRAGVPSPVALAPAQAIRIMTGAAMPEGADTVIQVEATSESDGLVMVAEVRDRGAHVRRRGEDVRQGDVVIEAGVTLAARHLAAAATVGAGGVEVLRRPRVGILSTGDELVPLGAELGAGQIYESNSVLLAGAIRAAGGVPVVLAFVGDTVDAVAASLANADADIVVTTGGVSVGDYDVVKAALAGRGVEFLSVAMQPGKPQGLGVVDGTPVICLPGNPVSVAVSFELFVAPMMRAMRGLPTDVEWTQVTAGADWPSPAGREQFMPITWAGDVVVPATRGGAGSHLMASLALADGLARVPADTTRVAVGDSLEARRFA